MDADHAGNRATRGYQTGVLIFLNKAPILCYSKQQNTVKTSTLLINLIAIKTATELVKSIWYKWQMFDIPIEGLSNMFSDNESAHNNVSNHESTLKKKNLSICYHICRETVATRVSRISKEGTAINLAGMFTKMLVQIRHDFFFG